MNDDIVVGKVYAYRYFRQTGSVLHSLVKAGTWEPGVNTAYCPIGPTSGSRAVWVNDPDNLGALKRDETKGHGRIPSWACDCGYYVAKHQYLLREVIGEPDEFSRDVVMAKVQIAGRVLEGSWGYRAEHARVVSIVTETPNRFRAALDRYMIEIEPPRTKAEEGFTTGWVGKHDHGTVKLHNLEPTEMTGVFCVNRGVEVPETGSYVTAEFERRGTMRWITSFQLEDDG